MSDRDIVEEKITKDDGSLKELFKKHIKDKELVEGKIVKDDASLIELFKKHIKDIKFIREDTREALKKIDEKVNLNYQSEDLVELWKYMIGNAIVFLKKNDAREKYHDQMRLGVGELHKYLKEYKEFEKIFYGSISNYRDHVIHIFRTYLLGDFLIRNTYGYKNVDPVNGTYSISVEEKEAMWCIIALSHDLGYPLEKIHILNDPIRKILKIFGPISISEFGYDFFPQFAEFSQYTIRFMSSSIETKDSSAHLHVQSKFYQKFGSALTNYNHGVLSSILLMKDLVYFKESDYAFDNYKTLSKEDLRQFLIRKNILRAIASHNCPDIYYLTGTNFSFLLKAFDEMQEWGRPRLIDITKRGGTQTRLQINQFDQENLDYKITFDYPEEYQKFASKEEKDSTKKEIKQYFIIKCGEWMNILRSAVGGNYRKLKVSFSVEDHIDTFSKYELIHETPETFDILPLEVKEKILKDALF